ncbi:hypothetical protein M514_04017 [Trichuris suis]|uniref:Uncharacterized protein n=1 Tax=Trichuris suis TaxID=68888 RepID=A0A085MD03_9BILA|nr:hypothetical protein M513_04017 [Trichuris suis]KFD72546.1 hypothetical protein M514_04017 [Trichuris suis]
MAAIERNLKISFTKKERKGSRLAQRCSGDEKMPTELSPSFDIWKRGAVDGRQPSRGKRTSKAASGWTIIQCRSLVERSQQKGDIRPPLTASRER